MGRTWSPPGPYRVGDRVKVAFLPPAYGRIVEDRGLIGQRRRHYYTVSVTLEGVDEPLILEYPAEELEKAPAEDVDAP